MSDEADAAQQAAQLMAQLCSIAGTVRTKREVGLLLRRERITLAQFSAALSALSDERGAAAYAWEQEQSRSDDMRDMTSYGATTPVACHIASRLRLVASGHAAGGQKWPR